MVRSRPELPSDSEPVGDADDRLKKRRRKRRDQEPEEPPVDETADAAPDDDRPEPPEPSEPAEAPPQDERVRREIAAEAAFRQRVTLAELADRLSPESYAALEQALAGRSVDWRLEKGRYLFAFLVGERSVPSGAGTARIEQKLALGRDEPPLPPERVDELVSEAVAPDEPAAETARKLASLQAELPPGDEVRVRTAPDQPEIVVTAEAVTVAPSSETTPAETAAAPTGTEAESSPDLPEPSRQDIDRLVAEIEREPEETTSAGLDASESRSMPDPDRPVPREREREPVEPLPETASADLAAALELLDREAVDLNDLPPIRGGAPEPGEPVPPHAGDGAPPETPDAPPEQPGQVPEQPPEPPAAPEPETPDLGPPIPERHRPSRGRRHRPRSRRGREVLRWDPDAAEVVRYPDHAMRRKARKLVRRMAAEYGIKLTPQIEAYLLSVVLRPHLIHGRAVYSIGMNVETLISVLQVLKYNFNITRRPPA